MNAKLHQGLGAVLHIGYLCNRLQGLDSYRSKNEATLGFIQPMGTGPMMDGVWMGYAKYT